MTGTTLPWCITSGVDTHLDVHEAAAFDERGPLLGVENFATTDHGYKKLLGWLSQLRPCRARRRGRDGFLWGRADPAPPGRGRPPAVEVHRPNRQRRRLKGKSHPQDAIPAARAALSGDAIGQAKSRDGNVESMRHLRVARASARKDRTQALNQMRNMLSTAPDLIRAERRGLSVFHLLERASSYRPGTKRDIVSLTKFSLRMLARRAPTFEEEISEIDAILKPLAKERTRSRRHPRHRHRRCLGTARRGRRQPRTPAQRGGIRPSLWHLTARCQQWEEPTTPTYQALRRPGGL